MEVCYIVYKTVLELSFNLLNGSASVSVMTINNVVTTQKLSEGCASGPAWESALGKTSNVANV